MSRSPLAVFDATGHQRFANEAWRELECDREVIVPHVRAAIAENREVHIEDIPFGARTCAATVYPFDGSALVCADSVGRALDQQFVEVVSHELRTPIATMALWVDVLQVATSDDVRARAAEAIAHSCAAQTKLVRDLLDLSRALSRRLQIDRRPVAIEPVLRETVDLASAAAAERQLAFTHSFEDGLGSVIGDGNRLRQIAEALIETAIERTPPSGRVTMSARRARNAIEIHVRDSGSGSPPEQLATMFEPFAAGAIGAFGLKLALAHHLVRLHAGTLVAYTEGIGSGLLLALVLPSAEDVTAIT